MRLYEITNAEIKAGRDAWNSSAFDDYYHRTAINLGTEAGEKYNAKTLKDIHKYVRSDMSPSGTVGKSLQRAIKKAEPSVKDIVSYRGMRLSTKRVKNMLQRLDRGETITIKNTGPASFTNSKSAAADFAKDTGYRKGKRGIGVIFEIVIPEGTQILPLNLSFGIGLEHVVAADKQMRIISYKKYRNMYVLRGELI